MFQAPEVLKAKADGKLIDALQLDTAGMITAVIDSGRDVVERAKQGLVLVVDSVRSKMKL